VLPVGLPPVGGGSVGDVTGKRAKVAVTDRLPVIDTVHEAVLPEQAPLQPEKLEPAAGVAVSVTEVPSV
jgi:hypothetical protein